MRTLWLALLAPTSLGCNSRGAPAENTGVKTSSAKAVIDSLTGPQLATGPIALLADSTLRGAKLEIRAGKATVRLSPAMFRTLSDSLPQFVLYPTSAYDSAVWASELDRDSTAILPSVVTGDFDADGQTDVALNGLSHGNTAEIILLSDIAAASRPTLLFMNRPRPAGAPYKTDVLLRVIDKQVMWDQFHVNVAGVQEEFIGKGSVIFYIDRGALREIQTGD